MRRSLFAARYFGSLSMAQQDPGKYSWYRIAHQAKADIAEIYVYDEIGFWGVPAADFIRDLKAVDAKSINLRLNTPGGIVTEGHAMFNALVEHPAQVTTYNDGLAASMGSILMLAGSEAYGGGGMKMSQNAMFMIHNPWGIAIGDDDALVKEAEILGKMKGILADAYVSVSGKEKNDILAMMKDETWMTADEAKEFGFASEVVNGAKKAVVKRDHLAYFSNVPAVLKSEESDPEPAEAPAIIAFKRKQLDLMEL